MSKIIRRARKGGPPVRYVAARLKKIFSLKKKNLKENENPQPNLLNKKKSKMQKQLVELSSPRPLHPLPRYKVKRKGTPFIGLYSKEQPFL